MISGREMLFMAAAVFVLTVLMIWLQSFFEL